MFLLTNKLQEKENFIICLKKEMEKGGGGGGDPKVEKKVYVCDPSRNNIDINNELNSTRDILAKISKMLNAEKNKNEKLNHELTIIKNNTVIMTPKCSCDRGESKFNSKIDGMTGKKEEDDDNMDDILAEISDSSEGSIDSTQIQFPDKVKMNKDDKSQAAKNIPKLDFSKVKEKYEAEEVKKVVVADQKKKPLNKLEEQIEKLKNELKQANKTIDDLNTRLEKYRSLYKVVREKLNKKTDIIKKNGQKIEQLETQIKKYGGMPSTEDISNKRNLNNESIVRYNLINPRMMVIIARKIQLNYHYLLTILY
jgi:chromosome segregation ATPase